MLDLSHMLASNNLLISYTIDSNIAINNYLRGNISNGSLDKVYTIDSLLDESYWGLDTIEQFSLKSFIHGKSFIDFIKSGFVFTDSVPYNPITPRYINQLIQLDSVIRASKSWNTKPITVYRGCNSFNTDTFNEMLSTSTKKEVALMHAIKQDGVVLKINLPANFPYIEPNKCLAWNAFDEEAELILPPCGVEIVGEWTSEDPEFNKYIDSGLNIKLLEVNLYPKSLARTFLKRFKKMPADFPQEFISDPMFEFSKARSLLHSYVRNYVDMGKIPFAFGVMEELKTPNLNRQPGH